LALCVCLMLPMAQPAQAVYPQGKTMFVVWELWLNIIPPAPAPPAWIADCVRFTNARMYSFTWGPVFGPLEMVEQDPLNPSVSRFEAKIPTSPGRMFIQGQADRLGFLGSVAGTVLWDNFAPGFNLNLTVQGHEENTFCPAIIRGEIDPATLGISTREEALRRIEEALER
jgi:hypothetical protein